MIYLFLYLTDVLPSLWNISIFVFLLASIAILVMVCYYCQYRTDETEDKFIFKTIKTSIIVCMVSGLLLLLIPKKETMYAMAAVRVGKQISSDIQLGNKLDKVSQLLDLQLDKSIERIKEGK